MLIVYIAGPFRGANAWEIERNVRRAEELAFKVWLAGGVALCPHTNTRFFHGTLSDDVWLRGTLELMERCDAVLLGVGWRDSRGAVIERDRAEELSIPVFYAVESVDGDPTIPAGLLEMIERERAS